MGETGVPCIRKNHSLSFGADLKRKALHRGRASAFLHMKFRPTDLEKEGKKSQALESSGAAQLGLIDIPSSRAG
jgi:hypothetical protein